MAANKTSNVLMDVLPGRLPSGIGSRRQMNGRSCNANLDAAGSQSAFSPVLPLIDVPIFQAGEPIWEMNDVARIEVPALRCGRCSRDGGTRRFGA